MEKQTPVTKINAGAVSCALWENEISTNGHTAKVLRATVDRRFKAEDGTWRSSSSFSRNEIPLAIFCLTKAFEAIIKMAGNSSQEDGNGSRDVS